MKPVAIALLALGVVIAIVLLTFVGLRVLGAALIRRLEYHGRDGL